MHALFITLGSHGDIHPFIDIAKAMQARGHQATLCTNPYFQQQIEQAQIDFEPFGQHQDLREIIEKNKTMDATVGPLVVLRQLLVPEVANFIQRTRELIREHQPDVVVYHPIVMGVPWVCQLEGLARTVSISPSPLLWGNPNDPSVLMPFRTRPPGPLVMRIERAIAGMVLGLALDPALNRLRKKLGLPAQRENLHRAATEAAINLGIWSPLLRPPLEGDPCNAHITGFTWHDQDHTQQASIDEILQFLGAGSPPIVFALGSTGVHAAAHFYEHAVHASRALGERALLIIGRDQPPPQNMHNDVGIKSLAYAPYSQVFPRARIVVHHGGAGTTAQALRAGNPTLITPMAHDQFDNASRVHDLGVGDTLRFACVNASRLRKALQVLLLNTQAAHAAKQLAPCVAAEDGSARSAEIIAASAHTLCSGI